MQAPLNPPEMMVVDQAPSCRSRRKRIGSSEFCEGAPSESAGGVEVQVGNPQRCRCRNV